MQTALDYPVARRHQPPGPAHEYPAVRANDVLSTRDTLEELEADWLFRISSPEGRRRLMIEHGLIPR